MTKMRDVFGNINDRIIRGLPEWTKHIAAVMASVVNMTTAIIRGAGAVFRAIKRIFDMIPTELRILMGAFTAFSAYIRAGPIGKMMMAFALLMMLVEDFFVYLDGGDALLGGLWRTLINLWDALNEGGGFIDRLRAGFISAMETISGWIGRATDWIRDFWRQLQEGDAIENFSGAFERVGNAVGSVFRALTGGFDTLVGGTTPFLVWLISEALPGAISLIASMAGAVANAVGWFFELSHAREILTGLAVAIGSLVAGIKLYNAYLVVTKTLQTALNAIKMLNPKVAIITAIIAAVALLIKNWDTVADFFQSLWERITGIFRSAIDSIVGFFRGIIEWIRDNWLALALFLINPLAGVFKFLYDNFEGFRNFVDNVVAAIKRFFTGLWRNITEGAKNFVNAVVGFFVQMRERKQEAVQGIVAFFLGLWERVKEGVVAFVAAVVRFFAGMIEGIGEMIGRITGFFSSAWETAKELARAFIEGVLNIFRPLVDFLNGIGDRIRSIFGGRQTLEVDANLNVSEPSAGHAEGGIFDKEHVARFAEGNQAEAIVPLTKPNRAREVLSGIADYFGIGKQQADGESVGAMRSIADSIAGMYSALRAMDAGLSQPVSQHTTYVTYNYNNQTYDLKSNYNISDTSGKPATVAKAVDGTKQNQMRNLQGILGTV